MVCLIRNIKFLVTVIFNSSATFAILRRVNVVNVVIDDVNLIPMPDHYNDLELIYIDVV